MVNRKQMKIELSIVIPAYNEAKRISSTLRAINQYIKKARQNTEVVVVDDGSIDGTGNTVSEVNSSIRIIRHAQNHGKGDAVRTGVLAAKGGYILMMDADNSIKVGELDKLWPYRKQCDLVIGSRFMGKRRFWTQRKSRLIISKLGNLMFKLLFKLPIRDTQCGFKLFNARRIKPIFKKLFTKGFGFDMELLVRAYRDGLKIKEVAVDWHDSPGSSIRAARAAWQTFKELIILYIRSSHLTIT